MNDDATQPIPAESSAVSPDAAAPEPETITVGKALWAVRKIEAHHAQTARTLGELSDEEARLQQELINVQAFRETEAKRLEEAIRYPRMILEGYYHQQNRNTSTKKPVTLPGGHRLTYSRAGYDYTHDDTRLLVEMTMLPDALRPAKVVETPPPPPTPGPKLMWGELKKRLTLYRGNAAIELGTLADDGAIYHEETGEVLPVVYGDDGVFVDTTTGESCASIRVDDVTRRVYYLIDGATMQERQQVFEVKLAGTPEPTLVMEDDDAPTDLGE